MIYIGETQVLGSYLGEEQAEEVFVGEEVVISGTTSGDTPAPMGDIIMVDNISAAEMGWDITKHIELPLTMTTGTSFYLQGLTYGPGDRAIGYSWEDIGDPGYDGIDFRAIFAQDGYLLFDLNAERMMTGGTHLGDPGYEFALGIGNYYIYDAYDGVMLLSGTPESTIAAPNQKIRVDVSSFYLKKVEVYEDGIKVFDGYPAIEVGPESAYTHVGLHNTVSGEFIWNSGISMSYNLGCLPDPETFHECLCAERGGTWDPINETCNEGGGGGEESSSSEDTGVYCECIDSQVYSQEECDCICQGGVWNGESCDYQSEPDPCAGMSPGECDCINQGGVWDPESEQCNLPDPCMGDPECECLNQGGVWDPDEGVCMQ